MNRIKLIAASMFYTGVIAIALCTLLASPKVVLAEKPATPSAHHPPNQRVDIDNVDLNTNVTISWIDFPHNHIQWR